jgi:hypothetical protein
MGERHVEELFSLAYDDALSDSERARFEAHLAHCEACAAALEEFRTAVDAVRALPAATMPVRVVLPATPPVAERRSLLPWLRLPRLGPAWGAGAMAAVGIAAVVIVVHAHGGGAGSNATSGAKQATGLSQFGAADARSAGGAGNSVASCTSRVLSITTKAQAGSGGPAGFANRVKVTIPQRPGQELVLATTSSHYTAGSEVLVFAALTTSTGQHAAVVPCVTLQGSSTGYYDQFSTSPASVPASRGGAGGGAPAASPNSFSVPNAAPHVADVPLAIAIPTSQSIAGTLPVQVLTIPADIPKGTVLRLVALIPAGIPGNSDAPPVEAVLTLEVS